MGSQGGITWDPMVVPLGTNGPLDVMGHGLGPRGPGPFGPSIFICASNPIMINKEAKKEQNTNELKKFVRNLFRIY